MISQDVLESFRGSNCVVTGGAGMIGREVVRLLCDVGANVKCVSLDRIEVHPKADHVYADLTDYNVCNDITKDMDHVFHIAGIKGSVDVTKSKPASFLVPLLMMNTNVLEAARRNKAKRVLYTSTIGAYAAAEVFKEEDYSESQPPMDHYPGWAKRIAEMQVQTYRVQYGLENFAIVRPCNVYGPGDSFKPESAMVIPSLLMRIYRKEDPVVIWGDGSAIRDFAFATDCAEGCILALHHGTRLQVGDGGEGHELRQMKLLKAERNGRLRGLRGITQASVRFGQAPADFHAGRKRELVGGNM